ncbi:Aldehyde/histidinol dehydrogenase [Neurospora hispaniola]|uniref:aldehyde dehydrogenase (NAD(+)) n=1 Tax=Neurospora hispaniola TaxID=588809 RepID=A0AAJ0I517_9PEZI|nr:Aldehyde/histidinol dehydrogenase [Neurospora hispaniola]
MEELEFHNIINDTPRSSPTTHTVTDPRTESPLWPCPIASPADFEDAVASAQIAFKTWKLTPLSERQALLTKLATNLEDHLPLLSQILARESGKSLLLSELDVRTSIAQCLHYAQPANALSDHIQYEDETVKIIATHVPLGVVAAICPWNFPLILSSIKVVSSLVTGNCVIVKPSPFTPYAVMKWIELARGILPPGVLQVLNGGADLGQILTLHPGIAKVSFTGTIAVGKAVMAACAKTLKKVTLELAGNNACIVCADADLPKAVKNVASGAFFNAGQVCVATKRVYVHESVYEEFVRRLVEEVKGNYTMVEDASVPSVFGPVSNKVQFETVKRIVEDCKGKGYEIVAGGEVRESGNAEGKKGFWLEPTIVKGPPDDSVLVKEEQFGPILPVMSWSDEDDVINRSNLANAGLGASVYSSDLAQAERIARRLEAGGVWINKSERPHMGAYFSGFKDSGFGGEMGKQGLLSYSYTQSIHFAK